MSLFETALTNVVVKTARNDVIALSGTTQKASYNLSSHDCVCLALSRGNKRDTGRE